jgi:hypothetical protein
MSTEINKNNPYGYVIIEHDFPYDTEIYDTETYEEAQAVVNIILREKPERKIYIREITREEIERIINIKANMM